jgi:O-antigen/teichoic acid export membrane protein
MALKRNLIANYLGQAWVAIMGLAFIPIYIKYLGIEAYGLIGLFALLQAWLSLLDMGMTPTLGREMARFTAGTHSAQSIRDLLRSIEVIAFVIAILIASGIALSANWMAHSWVQAESLPSDVVAEAFVVMGVVTAVRFMESIYRSSIVGLQRHVLFNVVNCTMATLRSLGGVGVLVWVSASIEAFFIWQGIVTVATVIVMAITTYSSLPHAERTGRFSFESLICIWRFAGGMLGITILSLLLMQVDKVLLSKLLSLKEFGYYTLAALVAGALYTVITPITQAVYPRLCELHARNDQIALIETYHKGAQLVTVFGGSIAIVIVVFAEKFMHLWTQDIDLASRTGGLLSLLMLGNLLNGLMWMPYQAQIAHGWTSLAVKINIVAFAVIVPAILCVTPRYGAEGAALVWMTLNVFYVLIGVNFMYRRILTTEKWRWYKNDCFIPLISGAAAAAGVKQFWSVENSNLADISLLVIAAFFTISAMLLSASIPRKLLKQVIKLKL